MRTGLVWPGLKLSSNFIAHNTVLIDRMCVWCGGSNLVTYHVNPSTYTSQYPGGGRHPPYVSRQAA